MLKLPSYLKFVIILFGLIMLFFVLIIGRSFVVPVVTAFIFALILQPVCTFLEKWKIPRGLSSILSIILIFVVLFFTFYFISIQVGSISRDLSEIGSRFQGFVDEVNAWLSENLGIAEGQQAEYFKDSISDFVQSSSSILTNTLSATADFFTSLVLIFISLFFLLYYRSFFVEFLYRLIPADSHTKLGLIIKNGTSVVRAYVIGLFTVILILAILNTTGLMLIGIEHAMFFGVLAAMLTVIPYFGVIIGSILPILFAFLTKDSLWYPIGVAIMFWVVQFLEGNFITPNIVGNKVSLNPFVVILALFIGGMVWGAIGMILAIPVVAMLKVIFDSVDSLKPFGFLMGYPPHESGGGDPPHKVRKEKNIASRKKVNA